VKILSAADVARLAPYLDIVEALREGFRGGITSPARLVEDVGAGMTLLVMPAWSKDWTGLKTVTYKASNPAKGFPAITASYLLIDNANGATVALLDGTELTRRRTAAASALAAGYLAAKEASHLTVVGAGDLSRHFVRAHATVRPIKKVSIFSRTRAKSEDLARDLSAEGFEARVVNDPEAAVRESDIVTCITGSAAAIVKGQWLKPGAHLDLAGAFTPSMREADAEAVARLRRPAISSRPATRAVSISPIFAAIFPNSAAAWRRGGNRRRRSLCSSPVAWRSRTLPPPSWCTKKRYDRRQSHLRCS
jgi:alanine dehydrogenase